MDERRERAAEIRAIEVAEADRQKWFGGQVLDGDSGDRLTALSDGEGRDVVLREHPGISAFSIATLGDGESDGSSVYVCGLSAVKVLAERLAAFVAAEEAAVSSKVTRG